MSAENSETKFEMSRGSPFPYGASKHHDGFNFALFSKHATHVSLCLFLPGEKHPFQEIPLDPNENKTGNVWHVFVHQLPDHYQYGYRVTGPYDPFRGHFFDNRCILLDPYARSMATGHEWGKPHGEAHIQQAVVNPSDYFDWGHDAHPNIPLKDLIIYEMHVRGFTQDSSSNVANKGTFKGMIEKIPYLKSLGINAVELLPIHEFNENENIRINPKTQERLYNYWGYSTINFFSPMNRYGTGEDSTITEFKMLVKELHANGIEVILDVVYNHTAEGNQDGPVLSFKGLENSVYYMLAPNGEYYNFSGCGNTFNCNHPVVRELIRASLRYWVTEMHVDGFRFDLASVLVRSHDGIPLAMPPLIEAITCDPILANTKLIAEAWDAGGLYQVGSFPGMGAWAEWNGKYRDEVRRFIKGSEGEIGNFATRISGSEDLYGRDGRDPSHSINFVTAHDGFSLADLVSYNEKHNEENGESNRDGANDNESWNCGEEGETTNPDILSLRKKQIRNFHLALMVSQGVPMILMGDEYGHTKNGNNNTWALDSRSNWFQWDALEKEKDFFRFYKEMIDFRKRHPIFSRAGFLTQEDIVWHGIEPGKPDWSKKSRMIAYTLPDFLNNYMLYIAFNTNSEAVTLKLPTVEQSSPWVRIVDTSLPSPQEFIDEKQATPLNENSYTLAPYSSLILKTTNIVKEPEKKS